MATHFEKITHLDFFFQSALNLGPNHCTLKKMTEWQTAVNIDSYSILKSPLKDFPKDDKDNTFILANLCPKISKRGRWTMQKLIQTTSILAILLQNLDKWTYNRIVDKIFEVIDSFLKINNCLWNFWTIKNKAVWK